MNECVGYEARTADGKWCDTSKVIGYCHFNYHKGAVTRAILKSHQCVERQCYHFEYVNPEYWDAIERAEAKKKEQAAIVKATRKYEAQRDALTRTVLEPYKNIYITKISQENGCLTIWYIYDKAVDLRTAASYLKKVLGCEIKLIAVSSSDEAKKCLIGG